jgi:hypothetical protein
MRDSALFSRVEPFHGAPSHDPLHVAPERYQAGGFEQIAPQSSPPQTRLSGYQFLLNAHVVA